jgi:hypothetical protein
MTFKNCVGMILDLQNDLAGTVYTSFNIQHALSTTLCTTPWPDNESSFVVILGWSRACSVHSDCAHSINSGQKNRQALLKQNAMTRAQDIVALWSGRNYPGLYTSQNDEIYFSNIIQNIRQAPLIFFTWPHAPDMLAQLRLCRDDPGLAKWPCRYYLHESQHPACIVYHIMHDRMTSMKVRSWSSWDDPGLAVYTMIVLTHSTQVKKIGKQF